MRKTIISIGFIIFFGTATAVAGEDTAEQIRHLLEKETIQRADAALHEEPVTVTATRATRSAGGIHDFYSEGDYWWPNPEAPDVLISAGTEKPIRRISQHIGRP